MNAAMYKKILDTMNAAVYYVDTERKILYWNRAAEEITGYKAEEIIGDYCQNNLLQHTDMCGSPLCSVSCPLYQSICDGKERKNDVLLRRKNGSYIPVSVNISPVYDEEDKDKIIGAVELFQPILDRNANDTSFDVMLEGLIDASRTDQLTKLPNRRTLESFIAHRIDRFKNSQVTFGLMFADIDDFSRINDAFGHDTGDAVLRAIADVFSHNTRKDDIFGRWGGEEFVGIFFFEDETHALNMAERVRKQVAAMEVKHGKYVHQITISLGVTLAKADDDIKSIVKRADKLMSQSKQNGKNQVKSDFSLK